MSKILQFRPRPAAKAVNEPPVPAAPQETSYEDTEYRLCSIMATVSWAIQTGKIKEAEQLYNLLKASGYPEWMVVPSHLVHLVEDTDYGIAIAGKN